VPGIEAAIDKSVGPAGLKITLRASPQAQSAGDYVLTLYDANKNKILDVPTTVLAIEVQAGGGAAMITPKAPTPGTPQQAAKTTPGQEKPMPVLKQAPGIETGKRTPKVETFLKSIETAQSLEEVRTGFDKVGLSQSEADGLKREIEVSPVLKQKLEGLAKQDEPKAQAKLAQFKREASTKVEALKAQYSTSQQAKMKKAEGALPRVLPGSCPPSEYLIIDRILGAPIEPGVVFAVEGKGFGAERGSIDLMVGGHTYPAFISEWTACYVHARLSDEISGLRASNEAMLVVNRADGKVLRLPTSFIPLMETMDIYDHGEVGLGGSEDWKLNDFNLKNDWFVIDRAFHAWAPHGHAEITYASDLNVPNGSARTNIHGGCLFIGEARWSLHTIVRGPKGLPYR
jgi:hypothetical protein